MMEKDVVVCILENRGKILLVKRSSLVGTYRGKWSGICGYLEGNPYETAMRELYEEAGLGIEDLKLLKRGKIIEVPDENLKVKWKVYPYFFECKSPEKIKLNWENVEYRWIDPKEISKYETVPGLKEILEMIENDNKS
ncbi:MAG: NUDIX pyrophosphatase [Candidatus Aenigmatarchaeota archaeon]|nr:MAG: NUDIX pyrophosphatase [Candidatus Aenigmarchaeota archaeon]